MQQLPPPPEWLSQATLHRWSEHDAQVCLKFWESLWKGDVTLPEKLMFCEILSRYSRDTVLHAMRDILVEGERFRPNPGQIRSICLDSAPPHSPPAALPPLDQIVPRGQVKELVGDVIEFFSQKGEWPDADGDPAEKPYEPVTTKRIRDAMRCSGDALLVDLVVYGRQPKKHARLLGSLCFVWDKANRVYRAKTPLENVDTLKRIVTEIAPNLEAVEA